MDYIFYHICIVIFLRNNKHKQVTRELQIYNRRFKISESGPPRGPTYDPTWGYEPYWAKGDWIFEEKPKYTGDACGQACAPQYVEYGEICGIKRDKKYNLEHKTFKNFCELKNEDCTTMSQVQCHVIGIVRGRFTTRSTPSGGRTTNASQFYDGDDSDNYYNPHYGYEPYWPQGDWVFEEPRDRPQNITTTRIPMVCGEECNYLYRNITKVCAHRADNIIYHGCWWDHCSGREVDDLTQGFETFDTYCGFLDKQCRTGNETRLVFVHIGECLKSQDLWYKPLFEAKEPLSRLETYLSTLQYTFQNLSRTPFG